MQPLSIETNFNNKMECPCFIHIGQAPAVPVGEKDLHKSYILSTLDNSHAPVVVELVSIVYFRMDRISDVLSDLSHGMYAMEFATHVMAKNTNIKWNTRMAIYHYRILNNKEVTNG